MASSWSSSTSSAERIEGKGPPIPFRHGPLDYWPPKMCRCGQKAARLTSWSDANPGRRYFTCYRRRSGGCALWVWAEDPHPEFIQEMLRDLKHMVLQLKKENREMNDRLCDAAVLVEEHKEEVRTLKAKMAANALRNAEQIDATKHRISWMESQLAWYKFMLKCCVVVFVVLVWNKWFT